MLPHFCSGLENAPGLTQKRFGSVTRHSTDNNVPSLFGG